MKNKISSPLSEFRKYRRFSQPKQINNLPTKINPNISQIAEIYNYLYEDYFHFILCITKASFFEKINKQAKEVISFSNSLDFQTSSNLKLISKIKEDLAKKYDNDYKILSSEYQNFVKKSSNYNCLTHFRKHCAQTGKFALHNCSSKKQGKFIEIKIKNKNNIEETSYVICSECKQCYLSHFILMVCIPCNKKYFSEILGENEDENILPATWEKYHCGPIINEIMKCIKCHDILYLNLTNKQLVCKNKNCNFVSKPESILWKCFICSTDFRSGAKIYNPLEFQILKKSINFALIMRKKAAPRQLPCGCEKDISKLTFFHKEECKGEVYKGLLIDKEIIVCSKCHAINFEEKYTWICPVCSVKFHLHSMVGCKPFSKKKYIINRHFNQSVKYLSKKNKNKDKKEKNINNINLYNKKDMSLEKSANNSNLRHSKNVHSIDILNQSIKAKNYLNKKGENESNNYICESKSIINLKKSKNCPRTAEKRKKHYSTLLEILQERKRSQPKKDSNITNKESHNSEIDNNSKKKNISQRLYNNKKYYRNKIDNLHYKNKTSDHFYKKEEKLLKQNLKEDSISNNNNTNNTNISNNLTNLNIEINTNNDINNTPENITKITVNKRFHHKITPFNSDESMNDNNNKQKDILRWYESTDFSSLKTLSSNEYKTKNNIFNSKTSSNKTSNPLNLFRYRNKKYNTNNNSLALEYRTSKFSNQLTENSYQDMINDLRFSTKLNRDSFNSSLRISNFGNNSASNEIKDFSKKNYSHNINETSQEISEIKIKDNTLIIDINKEEKENKIENDSEKEIKNENKEINSNENKDQTNSEIEKDKKEVAKKNEESGEEKENYEENREEMGDKFDEIPPLRGLNKKNIRESFIISTDLMFQNVLISPEKLNSLANSSKIPSINECDYNFLKPIGEGTYGVVYLVENNETFEQFALKKIICRDYSELVKHKNELELIYSVKHENILKICGIQFRYLDETTSSIYILMELAQNDWNMEIKRRMLAKKYYKENEIVDILKQIIKGFLFLQEKNIAHRDIKPQNILLFPNNIYKIADFGEAKNIKNIAQQNTLRGSELYMSPVLYKGYKFNKKNVMHNPYKSDVFSLGYCLLYAICLNLKVLETVRELTTMRSIITSINKYISKIKYSDKLMNIIYKMIEPNEDERFDFEDLSIELEKNFK